MNQVLLPTPGTREYNNNVEVRLATGAWTNSSMKKTKTRDKNLGSQYWCVYAYTRIYRLSKLKIGESPLPIICQSNRRLSTSMLHNRGIGKIPRTDDDFKSIWEASRHLLSMRKTVYNGLIIGLRNLRRGPQIPYIYSSIGYCRALTTHLLPAVRDRGYYLIQPGVRIYKCRRPLCSEWIVVPFREYDRQKGRAICFYEKLDACF